MSIELVTGKAGKSHVSAVDAAKLHLALAGEGVYLLPNPDSTYPQITVLNANTIIIPVSQWLINGRHVTITSQERVSISSGQSGYNRVDAICFEYSRASDTGIESVSISVVRGSSTTGTAVKPSVQDPSLALDSTTQSTIPFAWINVNGLVPSIRETAEKLPNLHNLNYQLAPVDVIETARYGYIRSNGMLAGSAVGKVVTITVNGSNSATSSTGVVIGTVKAEYRPAVEQRALFGVQNGSWGIIRITTAGEIIIQHMYSSSNSLTWSSFMQTITYVAA